MASAQQTRRCDRPFHLKNYPKMEFAGGNISDTMRVKLWKN